MALEHAAQAVQEAAAALWQPQLEQQLSSQPHEASSQQHEDSSQQQLASQQPQPRWPPRQPIRRSRTQHPPPPQPQLEQQCLHSRTRLPRSSTTSRSSCSWLRSSIRSHRRASDPANRNHAKAGACQGDAQHERSQKVPLHRTSSPNCGIPPSEHYADFRQRAMPPHAELAVRSCRRMLYYSEPTSSTGVRGT